GETDAAAGASARRGENKAAGILPLLCLLCLRGVPFHPLHGGVFLLRLSSFLGPLFPSRSHPSLVPRRPRQRRRNCSSRHRRPPLTPREESSRKLRRGTRRLECL
ncbi:unnamed protein product, partial [Ectocarpus sp. 8 AP-2014]